MFIVCPSCSGPYSIAANQIAPLVQVACPHCEYRVILDFEAANDPALREPGHQFAQGYESAEAYFSVYSHVGKNPDAKPFAAPGVVGAAPTAAAEIKTAVGETSPATTGAAALAGAAASSTTPPSSPLLNPLANQPAGSSRNAKTVIHTGSKKPVPLDPERGLEAPRPQAPSGPTKRADSSNEAPTTPPPGPPQTASLAPTPPWVPVEVRPVSHDRPPRSMSPPPGRRP